MVQMFRMLYVSGAAQPVTAALLDDILSTSRSNNARRGITGMLLAGEGMFLQVLEGETSAVKTLARRIQHDPRHRHFMVLSEQSVSARVFGSWDMGFKRLDPSRATERSLFETSRAALENRISQGDGGLMLDTVLAFSPDFLATT